MSLLDIDERIVELVELVDLDKSPLDDKKKFDGIVDIGLVEGGCGNEHNVSVLRDFRAHCRILVSVGACAITGGIPATQPRGFARMSGRSIPQRPDGRARRIDPER